MGTTSILGRLKVVHPDLGFEGGVTLEGHVKSTLTKISDAINSRYYEAINLANAASVDFEHNFKCAFSELRINAYTVGVGGELTRIVSGGSPDLDDFSIIAKVGSETTQITLTNNTGSEQDVALVVIQGKGAEVLNDLADVNTTGKEDGQALVYSLSLGKFVPGASGDSSFKFQSITSDGTALVIKGGSIRLSDGRILYAASDLTHNIASLASSDGDWTGFIDLYSLGASSIVNNRRVYAITTANFVYIKKYSDDPSVDLSRYIPCGSFDRTGGVYGGLTTFPFRSYEIPANADASLVDSLAFTTVGAVGDAGQIMSGHVLAASSFPSGAIGANLSFYNLSDVSDASGNTRSLTNNGSATFAAGILGVAASAASLNGSSQYLSSANGFFNAGDNDFSAGGWFKPTSWSAGIQGLFGMWGAAPTRNFIIIADAGLLKLKASTDGTAVSEVSADVSSLTGWHHVAMRYTAATNAFELYVDGVKVADLVLSAGLYNYNGIFEIGRNADGSTNYFNGQVDEFYFGKYAFTANDILKIQASKYVHGKGLSADAQGWDWWIKSTAGIVRPLEYSPVVDQQPNELFFDLSQEASTVSIARKLFSKSQSGLAKPSKGQTLTLTTDQLDALLPLSHGLGVVPELSFKVSNGTDYEGQDWGSIFVVNSTQIKIAGDSLVTLFGTGVAVILTYSSGVPVSFVPNRFWNNVAKSSAYAAAINDRVFADVSVAGFTLTLPPSPSVGDEINLIDAKGAFSLTKFVTLARNGQPIRGGTSDFDCDQPNKLYRIVFVDATYGWDIFY